MQHERIFQRWTEGLQEWEKKDYAIPDPGWRYAELWKVLHENIQPEFETLIEEVQDIEDATPETDKAILVRLQWLQTYIDRCKSYLSVSDDG